MFFATLLRVLAVYSISYSTAQAEETFNKSFTFDEEVVPRVMRGWAAKLDSVPYQLALKTPLRRRMNLYYTFCGAVLITENTIFSAAHCFETGGSRCCSFGKVSKRTLRSKFAVAGNLYNKGRYEGQNVNGQWRKIKDMRKPRKYKFPRYDICVGHVSPKFIINSHVAPIPYATVPEDYVGPCLVSGFGRISKWDNSEILLMANLDLLTKSQCTRRARKTMNRFVCTDTMVADAGKGDSGGPLVCKGTRDPNEGPKGILVGIVCGNSNRYSIFTRVTSHLRFINGGHSFNITVVTSIWIVWMCFIINFILCMYF